MSKVVIFPCSKEKECQAYGAGCNSHYAANVEKGGTFLRPRAWMWLGSMSWFTMAKSATACRLMNRLNV